MNAIRAEKEAWIAIDLLREHYPARGWAVWIEHDHSGEYSLVATVITSAVSTPAYQETRVFGYGGDGEEVARDVIAKADEQIN